MALIAAPQRSRVDAQRPFHEHETGTVQRIDKAPSDGASERQSPAVALQALERNSQPMRPHPLRPVTLAELRQSTCWVWLYCDSCGRGAPAAVAPWIIRLGADASSDQVRRNARCAICRERGATLRLPSWGGLDVGIAPFPADRLARRISTPAASGRRGAGQMSSPNRAKQNRAGISLAGRFVGVAAKGEIRGNASRPSRVAPTAGAFFGATTPNFSRCSTTFLAARQCPALSRTVTVLPVALKRGLIRRQPQVNGYANKIEVLHRVGGTVARPVDLPDYTAPPLNEVAISVQFDTLTSYTAVVTGPLWELFRSEFPNVQKQVPLQPTFETFGPLFRRR